MRIEEKMGLHASPTCQMAFSGAKAELVGDVGDGLKAMFTLMNHARLDVALQGVAHAARAGQIARAYAAERKQGRFAGEPATLEQHADVRRMLDHQRILEISTSAMCHLVLVEMDFGARPALVEFLTPLCKVLGSEAGVQSANLGMQILGGYGYLEEYGLSQIWRDARIACIYEGANGIHMQALVTRGLRPGGGADEFMALVKGLCPETDFSNWSHLRAIIVASGNPGQFAKQFTELTGTILTQAIWTKISSVTKASSDPNQFLRLVEMGRNENCFDCRVT